MAITTAQEFMDAAAKRRSVYAIDSTSPLSQSEIESIVKQALEDCPSPWNSASSRAVILFGDNHKKLFDELVYPSIEAAVPPPVFEFFGPKIKGYAGGNGSVLFFDDEEAIKALKEKQPMVQAMADSWADVSNGMLQFAVWAALSVSGLGASLQHFNFHPGIVAAIRKEYNVPESWTLKAQLVFGSKTAEPGERTFQPSAPIAERIKVVA